MVDYGFFTRVFKEIQQSLSQEEQMKCKGLPIILGLYSNGFNLENPLRAKGRNSITAVYLYVMNLEYGEITFF